MSKKTLQKLISYGCEKLNHQYLVWYLNITVGVTNVESIHFGFFDIINDIHFHVQYSDDASSEIRSINIQ